MKQHPLYKQDWENVQKHAKLSNELTFCVGNYQWQGDHRISFWFPHGSDRDKEMINIFQPSIQELAQTYGLDYDVDIDVITSKMLGGLGILRIAGKKDGEVINKGMAAKYHLPNHDPWVFVGDGYGDLSLAMVTKTKNGKVVGIRGNLDDVPETEEFLATSDSILQNPDELAAALQYTAILLSKKGRILSHDRTD